MTIGEILTQPRYHNMDHPNSYASQNLNKTKKNYSTTKWEGLGMIFSLQKSYHYLLSNPFIFYIDHQALKYLVNQLLHHVTIYRWLLLFIEFEFKFIVWLGHANIRPNHLSRVQTSKEPTSINDDLPNTHLLRVESVPDELKDIVQFIQDGRALEELSEKRNKILAVRAVSYTLINGSLYKLGQNDILWRCVLPHEHQLIINESHAIVVGGHFQVETKIKNILQEGLWWPTLNRDCKSHILKCDKCQRIWIPLKQNEMPLMSINPNLTFEIWVIDFLGPFPRLGCRTGSRYIVTAIEYVTK